MEKTAARPRHLDSRFRLSGLEDERRRCAESQMKAGDTNGPWRLGMRRPGSGGGLDGWNGRVRCHREEQEVGAGWQRAQAGG